MFVLWGVDMASGTTLYATHRRREWQCIPVSEVSVDDLQAQATATARVNVPETSKECLSQNATMFMCTQND